MKIGFLTVGFFVVAIVVLIGATFAGWAWRYYTADVRGRVDAQETIKSGDSRIANYNHFFNLCASIQSAENAIDALDAELKQATTDKDRTRIRTNITGNQIARTSGIAQYNADASKSYTAGQFRSSQLPYQIPSNPYTAGGVKTSCA